LRRDEEKWQMSKRFVVAIAAVVLATAIVAAAAKDADVAPQSTVQCSAFKRMPNGTWYVGAPTTVSIGKFSKMTFSTISIGPHSFTFGGADLYEVIENKCGPHAPARRK
jgi:hypothetical protein